MLEENGSGTEEPVTPVENTAPVDTPNTITNSADTGRQADAVIQKAQTSADDWATLRTKLAGGDEKMLKRLSRYGTMQEAFKAGVEAQNKIGSLKTMNKPGDDATADEIAAYRAANGIPESPDKYELALPNGIVVGEDDKPLVDAFLKDAHDANIDPKTVNKFLATQLDFKEKIVQNRTQKDLESKFEAEKALSSPDVWGSEVQQNMNAIERLLAKAPYGVRDQIASARSADGTPLANNVKFLQWLATTSLTLDPHAKVVPGVSGSSDDVLNSEITKYEKMMKTDEKEYRKGMTPDGKTTNEARYRELLDLRIQRGPKR